MADLPVVVVFGPEPFRLQSAPGPDHETRELDCRYYGSDEDLNSILAQERPDVIVSFGDREVYSRLKAAPHEVRRRWVHFATPPRSDADLQRIGATVFCYFLHRVLAVSDGVLGQAPPLVSVFTPTFRTGERAYRAYRSLLNQTYDNWEWVVVDDSDDDGVTLKMMRDLAQAEPRIAVHSAHRRSGKIGEVKRRACALSQGDILVELDHDDELTPDALAEVVQTFRRHPRAGFVYSDWAEVAEDSGAPLSYAEGWGFGYGSYRIETFRGRPLLVANAPPLNAETMRHIVGAPNHVRAWRRDVYWQIGGHNPRLHVADDYELLLRTFLHTDMIHIPKLCYIQYLNSGGNAQDRRRSEIQRLVRFLSAHYDGRIHERLRQLGLPDPA